MVAKVDVLVWTTQKGLYVCKNDDVFVRTTQKNKMCQKTMVAKVDMIYQIV